TVYISVSDGLATVSNSFQLTVTPVNDAPVASNDAYTTAEDVVLNVPAAGVLTNDTDVENNALTASLVSGPTNGTVTLRPDGSFTYLPNTNFNGADGFTYKANDGALDSGVATVLLTVTAVNDAPSFTKGPDQTVNEDAGPQTSNNWATAISKGPPNESSQGLTFVILNNSNPGLFSAGPAIHGTNG